MTKCRDNRSTQTHHISYQPEITCTVFKGEHQVLTLLNRMYKNPPSKCFVEQLQLWLGYHYDRGLDLDGSKNKKGVE